MIPKPLRTLVTGTAIILGGALALNITSSIAVNALRFATDLKLVNSGIRTLIYHYYHYLFESCLSEFLFMSFFFNREELRCLVGFVEERGFTYASCAKGMLAYTGHLCTILLLSILAFALLVMVTEYSAV